MSYHSFSLDPRTVLGVGANASLEEIRDAYHAKSKKHHPDMGGDEWAFRMVTRAYEVLKTTAGAASVSAKGGTTSAKAAPDIGRSGFTPDWSGIWNPRFTAAGRSSASGASFRVTDTATHSNADLDEEDIDRVGQAAEVAPPVVEPDEFHDVDVELIWTRFEREGSKTLLSTQEGDDMTLSVCLVISWPPHELIDRATEFDSTGETLRLLIDLFTGLRAHKSVVAARSRIEDGRFVGWLSHVDVLSAQDAVLALRDKLEDNRLAIKLYTRDERVPFDWYGAAHEPVMAHA